LIAIVAAAAPSSSQGSVVVVAASCGLPRHIKSRNDPFPTPTTWPSVHLHRYPIQHPTQSQELDTPYILWWVLQIARPTHLCHPTIWKRSLLRQWIFWAHSHVLTRTWTHAEVVTINFNRRHRFPNKSLYRHWGFSTPKQRGLTPKQPRRMQELQTSAAYIARSRV
jgi:hypothetical protein